MKCYLTLILGWILFATNAFAAGSGDVVLKHKDWSFNGPFGTLDKAAMQRGFQAYREICASCHSLDYVAFRNLADLGYSEAEIKAFATEYEVEDGPNDEGEMFMRPGIAADRFPAPYSNEAAARAGNGGAYPPDLSLITKARANGPDYLYSLLTSYKEPPNDKHVPEGMYYNTAYPGNLIAMPQPIYGEDVTYADGAPTDVSSISSDLVYFLTWTAEPTLEKRKRTGVKVMIFLLIMVGMSYGAMKLIWADVKKA